MKIEQIFFVNVTLSLRLREQIIFLNVTLSFMKTTYEECNRIGPVDAKYVKSSNKDFNGNPFIEALPRPRDGKELIKAYTCPIPAVDMGELDDMTINEQKETVLSLKR